MESKRLGDRKFTELTPQEFPSTDINPYVQQYWNHGEPILIGAHAKQFRGAWSKAFAGREAELHVEIGAGNGFFLAGMAEKNPQQNWLGIEIRYKRVILCARKILANRLSNAKILRYDAWCLPELFTEDAISGLYTNHPDPWEKRKQSKNRLLNESFVKWASIVLKSGGIWRIKTDFQTHVLTVRKLIQDLPFEVLSYSDNIHEQGMHWHSGEDIITNYERKFIEKNLPIYALELRRC